MTRLIFIFLVQCVLYVLGTYSHLKNSIIYCCFSCTSLIFYRWTEDKQHSRPFLRLIRVNLFSLWSLTGQHVVRIMFSQVLICVWREVQEFIIHLTGGRSFSWDAARSEANLLLAYWHVPFVMNAAEVHLRNSPVRQPSRRRNTAQSIHSGWRESKIAAGLSGQLEGIWRLCPILVFNSITYKDRTHHKR